MAPSYLLFSLHLGSPLHWLPVLEAAAAAAFRFLVVVLALAWLVEDVLSRATQVVHGLSLIANRLGELGAAWRRLVAAVRTAFARWC